jgi:hypothetical protein
MDSKDQMRRVNELVAEAFRESGLAQHFRSPRYRYYGGEGGDRYFWTTEKINHLGKPRFVAGIYRYYKTKRIWKCIKKVGFAKRYKAKEWAKIAKDKGL